MDLDSFCKRLEKLRTTKGVSARDMSLSIGQSENYINKIENRRAFPSMSAFFNICEYLGVSEQDFFDIDNKNPEKINQLISVLKKLDSESLSHILGVVREMIRKE